MSTYMIWDLMPPKNSTATVFIGQKAALLGMWIGYRFILQLQIFLPHQARL